MRWCSCKYCDVVAPKSRLRFDLEYFCEDCSDYVVDKFDNWLCRKHEVPTIRWKPETYREDRCWAAYGESADGRRWRQYSPDGSEWYLEEI